MDNQLIAAALIALPGLILSIVLLIKLSAIEKRVGTEVPKPIRDDEIAITYFADISDVTSYFKTRKQIDIKAQLNFRGVPVGQAWIVSTEVCEVVDRDRVDKAVQHFSSLAASSVKRTVIG